MCLCGYQGHGKTEVSRYLERRWGYHREPFAESIRGMLVAAGVPLGAFAPGRKNEPCAELGGATPRDAMETLGAWGRGLSPLFWAQVWSRRLTAAGNPGRVVVDDARFDLETAYAMGEAGRRWADFLLVRVERPGADEGTDHESNRLPDVPAGATTEVLCNDGDLASLGAKVDALLGARGYL